MGLRRMTSRRPCLMRALAFMASILSFILVVTCIAVVLHNDLKRPPPPKNIIFMVSDGFGEAGLTLARLYKNTALFPRPRINGQPAPMVPLNLDAFATGNSHTYSASSLVTDSAAGATAWSCAQKTDNLKVATTVFEQPCGTLMEAAKASGMSTGVAVTSSVTDATPASFATHARRRKLEYSIALQFCTNRTADVILGGGLHFFAQQGLVGNCSGYPFVGNASALAAATSAPLLGLFADGDLPWEIDRDNATTPSLKAMALKAVELLTQRSARRGDGRGFFLVVEGSKIDKAAHPNDVGSHLREILAYDDAVGAMLNFAREDRQTLVLSTSDHETGGLSLGRGAIVGTPSAAEAAALVEAPLHTRSLIAEAEGILDTEYGIKLEVLTNQTASTEAMANLALRAVGSPTGEELAANATARLALVGALELVLRTHGGVGLLTAVEKGFLRETVELYERHRDAQGHDGEEWPLRPLGLYDIVRALGSIVSARAKLGWSSFGHSAEDVKLHAYGSGAEYFHGALENAEIGRRIASLMGFDLQKTTASLGTPLIAAQDRAGGWAQYANWPAPSPAQEQAAPSSREKVLD